MKYWAKMNLAHPGFLRTGRRQCCIADTPQDRICMSARNYWGIAAKFLNCPAPQLPGQQSEAHSL